MIRKDSAPLLKTKAVMRAKIDALYDSTHRKLSRQDAQILAKEFFGDGGSVSKGGIKIPKSKRYMVGVVEETETEFKFKIAGWGASWEEAFEVAMSNRTEAASGDDAGSTGSHVDGGVDAGAVRVASSSEGGAGGPSLTQEGGAGGTSGAAPQDGVAAQPLRPGPVGTEGGSGEHHAAGERTGPEEARGGSDSVAEGER